MKARRKRLRIGKLRIGRDTVTPASFGRVERGICPIEQFFPGTLRAAGSGKPDADADRYALPVAHGPQFFHGAAQPLGDCKRLCLACPREIEPEFLASETREAVAPAQVIPDQIGEGNEHLITRVMTVAVVDTLEMVQVHDEEAIALPARLRQLRQKPAPVADAGQRVGIGRPAQLRFRPLLDEHEGEERDGEVADDREKEGVGRGDWHDAGLEEANDHRKAKAGPDGHGGRQHGARRQRLVRAIGDDGDSRSREEKKGGGVEDAGPDDVDHVEMRGETDERAGKRHKKRQPVRQSAPAGAEAPHADPEQGVSANPEREAGKPPQSGRQQLLLAIARERRGESQEEEAARQDTKPFVPRRLPARIEEAEGTDQKRRLVKQQNGSEVELGSHWIARAGLGGGQGTKVRRFALSTMDLAIPKFV